MGIGSTHNCLKMVQKPRTKNQQLRTKCRMHKLHVLRWKRLILKIICTGSQYPIGALRTNGVKRRRKIVAHTHIQRARTRYFLLSIRPVMTNKSEITSTMAEEIEIHSSPATSSHAHMQPNILRCVTTENGRS